MTARADPIGPDELDALFAPAVADGERAGLAVSGGSDSTALMVLFADWLAHTRGGPGDHTVLSVDHQLRAQSADEAQAVARHAAQLGFRHATLVWEGPKPETGVQAAARSMRYELLGAYAARQGLAKLLTAHTADDQAETLIMRLARGSGLDGLSAMAPLTLMSIQGPALKIVRPLLEVAKTRLRATLEQRGIAWIEDPSNQAPAFERTRLRSAWGELEALGLTTDRIALSARRLRRAHAGLERWASDFCKPEEGHVHADRCGFIRIDGPALRGVPVEIAVRVLMRAVARAGGSGGPVPLAGVEPIAEQVSAVPSGGAWTLARAKITASHDIVLVEREPGRAPLPVLTLEPGAEALWDGRFLVRAGPQLGFAVEVRALGALGVRAMRQTATVPTYVPVGALRTLPAFWRGAGLIAVPSVGFWAESGLREALSATFAATGSDDAVSEREPDRLD